VGFAALSLPYATLRVVLGDVVQVRVGPVGLGQKPIVLGVPLRAGAAHIVLVGPIGAAGLAGSAPQLAKFVGQIAPHAKLPIVARWAVFFKRPFDRIFSE
jgi:hypothetical protein